MKKFLVILALFSATTLWGATGVGLINLDQSIPCPGGGEIYLQGGYSVVTLNITADLTFKNCMYVDDEDSITLNGSASITGTLPTTAGDLNLEVKFTDVQFDTKSSNETMSEKCSGDMTFTGTITNGAGKVTRTGNLNCSGTSTGQLSIDSLIKDLLYLNF